MAAIDNKHLLEIVNVFADTIPAKGDRKEFQLWKAQCLFHGADKGIQVGQLILKDSLKDTTPGKYLAEFELGVNYRLEVVPLLTALHPHGASSMPRANPAASGGASPKSS